MASSSALDFLDAVAEAEHDVEAERDGQLLGLDGFLLGLVLDGVALDAAEAERDVEAERARLALLFPDVAGVEASALLHRT